MEYIRLLRWSDIVWKSGLVRWRAENDKIGFEHETVLSPEALAALERARTERPAIGDSWLLPAPAADVGHCVRTPVQPGERGSDRESAKADSGAPA